jgi:RNA polymerase sigma-70 factor (ECF subfamily)
LADLAELGRLLEEHQPRLLAMLRRRIDPKLQRRLSAEDVLNASFLAARRKWADYQPHRETRSGYAWLYRIVLDTLIDAWREQNRARRSPDREMPWPDRSSIQLGMGLVNPATSPSQAVMRADLSARMRQALAALKEQDREILWMRHYDQLSYKEAAAVLGIKESAATLRYVRALKRLKTLWETLYPNDESPP